MTQEDKQLLLKDLCGRLPHKVVVDYGYNAFDVHNGNYVKHGSKCILTCYLLDIFMSPRQNEKGEYIKPYLRPMSSMTEEEKKEYESLCILIPVNYDSDLSKYDYYTTDSIDSFDWLNIHHFDYRGLIEKGLALEAPEGMYN